MAEPELDGRAVERFVFLANALVGEMEGKGVSFYSSFAEMAERCPEETAEFKEACLPFARARQLTALMKRLEAHSEEADPDEGIPVARALALLAKKMENPRAPEKEKALPEKEKESEVQRIDPEHIKRFLREAVPFGEGLRACRIFVLPMSAAELRYQYPERMKAFEKAYEVVPEPQRPQLLQALRNGLEKRRGKETPYDKNVNIVRILLEKCLAQDTRLAAMKRRTGNDR